MHNDSADSDGISCLDDTLSGVTDQSSSQSGALKSAIYGKTGKDDHGDPVFAQHIGPGGATELAV